MDISQCSWWTTAASILEDVAEAGDKLRTSTYTNARIVPPKELEPKNDCEHVVYFNFHISIDTVKSMVPRTRRLSPNFKLAISSFYTIRLFCKKYWNADVASVVTIACNQMVSGKQVQSEIV